LIVRQPSLYNEADQYDVALDAAFRLNKYWDPLQGLVYAHLKRIVFSATIDFWRSQQRYQPKDATMSFIVKRDIRRQDSGNQLARIIHESQGWPRSGSLPVVFWMTG
jgi:hypothetical protein